jgi:tetratricopeptide (TPR) repeat protein
MSAYASLSRSQSLIELGRWQDALEQLGPSLVDPDTEAEAHCLRAQCLLGLRRPADALVAAGQSLAVDAQREWPHRLRAIALMQKGRHRAAVAAARESARLGPGVPEALHILALTLVNSDKVQAAQEVADALLAEHPHSPLAYETAAAVAMARKQWVIAEGHFREALRLRPEDADVARGLGDALRAQGRKQEAGEVYLASARLDPTSTDTRRVLGRLGLPIVGGFAAVKWVAYPVVRLTYEFLTPLAALCGLAVALALGAGVTTVLRLRGTRLLPERVHRGLLGDHRNFALTWLWAFGWTCVPVALWSALISRADGGGLLVASAVICLAAVSWLLSYAWWVGPPPRRFSWLTGRLNWPGR